MKDIIITAGGKNITPSEIENQLKFSPYISDAVVIGDKRTFLTCLIMIDHDNVEKFAQDNNVPFTNYASLCRAREVQDLIWAEIERVNANFARVETIKKFRLIEQQLTAEDEELTPTMKLKRKFVNKKYKAEIDGMYRGRRRLSGHCRALIRLQAWQATVSRDTPDGRRSAPASRQQRRAPIVGGNDETDVSKRRCWAPRSASPRCRRSRRPRSPTRASRRPRS